MSDLTNYFSQQDRINELKDTISSLCKRLKISNQWRYDLKKSRDKLSHDKESKIKTIIKLQNSGHLIIDDEDLAGILFIEKKSLIEARCRILKAASA